ncbi:MAG TPA: hypothetical protein DF613_16710 [Lachnospiraceae bacterium]|nr:hypothetical protein [Lachnospiraceae bacterium]
MDEIEKLKIMTGEGDTDLLSLLYADAVEFVLSYTNRTVLPDALKKTVRDLAVVALNRMGTEGESGRSEGGESYSFVDAPGHIYGVLDRYRLARVGGYAFEKKPDAGLLP